jgi:hypothetical protein
LDWLHAHRDDFGLASIVVAELFARALRDVVDFAHRVS